MVPPVNPAHHPVHQRIHLPAANAAGRQTLRPQVQDPMIHRNPLNASHQLCRQADECGRRIVHKHGVEPVEQCLPQRIEEETHHRRTILQDHPELVAVASRDDGHPDYLNAVHARAICQIVG